MGKTILFGASYRRTLVLLAVWLTALATTAQTLKGSVKDSRTGEAIIGATVALKSGHTLVGGVTTDIDGNFTLKVNKVPAVLVVNYAGYNQEEIDLYEVSDEAVEVALTEKAKCSSGNDMR